MEELFYNLKGGKFFSKLDLNEAYTIMSFSDNSNKFQVIKASIGLYQYQRLPFGIASTPGIFHRFIEEVAKGMTGCVID